MLGSPLLSGINIIKAFSLYQSLDTYKICLDFQGSGWKLWSGDSVQNAQRSKSENISLEKYFPDWRNNIFVGSHIFPSLILRVA